MTENERIAQLEEEVSKLEKRLEESRVSRRELGAYEARLTQMVRERRGGKVDAFIAPQIEITARAWRRLDKMDEDMEGIPSVVKETGSMGQQRAVLNPLFPMYDKLQRTVSRHFRALGLNYDAAPGKVSEAGAGADGDRLTEFMKSMSDDGQGGEGGEGAVPA